MKLYKKEKLIETKLSISKKFTISKIHKTFTICYHTVVGETPQSTH